MDALSVCAAPASSDLVARIEEARRLLDDNDLKAARMVAGLAYDEARAVASSAERVKASRQLIDKARRMQADALYVESQCIIRMADAVDEAQARGQISRGGRPKRSEDEDRFTLDDVGLDKRRLKEARDLRNAEMKTPGFVASVIEARISEGLEPSRANLRRAAGHAIGTKSASRQERGDNFYPTPEMAVTTLLALEGFSGTIWEPACGKGAISTVLEHAGYAVKLSDLVDRGCVTADGECQEVADFTKTMAADGDDDGPDIVTNPPYGKNILNRFVAHALRVHKPRKMALLLNLNFMCGFEDPDRCFAMDECPPSRVYVFVRRLPMMHRDGWDGEEASSQMNTAWFVWERNRDGSYGDGSPRLIRVDWAAYETATPLVPGDGGHSAPLIFTPSEADEFARETPRRTLDERVAERLDEAVAYATGREWITAGELRRRLGVRPSTGAALVEALVERGLFLGSADDEGRFWAPGMGAGEVAA